jgi:L-lactate dehydrogenase complex protein LldG
MTNKMARDEILASIRSGSARLDPDPNSVSMADVEEFGLLDKAMDREALIEEFRRYAAEEAATSERVAAGDVPKAIVRYLTEQELPLKAIAVGEIISGGVDWSQASELGIVDGPIHPDGDTVVTGCYAGLAEAGAVVTVSSATCPNEFQFLAATHIVIVPAGRIFANYEALWVFVGNEFAAGMPRSMNWIVGPSRTADLGVPSRLGAHGPARLHLLIVDD